MRRPLVLIAAIVLPLAITGGFAGYGRVALLGDDARIDASPVMLDPHDPARRRVGSLEFLAGVELTSPDPAFGGFSSMAVAGDRFTLLSDDGNIVRFRLDRGVIHDARFASLPDGPATGWTKADRDSESMVIDPATDTAWVGFEQYNQIWRYDASLQRTSGWAAPPAMAAWKNNGGIETMARLADGRFVAISESTPWGESMRAGLVWSGDPVASVEPAYRFYYRPTPGYSPVDMTQMPDGRLLVLERRFALPFRWSNRLLVIDLPVVKPDAIVAGHEIASLAAPLVHDNFEGVATTREGDATIIWLVSDDNRIPLQRSLLLKFRLAE